MSPIDIVREVESDFCLRPGTLVSRDRSGSVAEARRWAVARLYQETDLSLVAIGRLLGDRDRSTIHALVPGRRPLRAA